jgi:thioesterase domain-containing protein/acyl carrier protein
MLAMTDGEVREELPVFWQSIRERARHKRRGPALRVASGLGAHPLSFAQERLWQYDQLGIGNRVHRTQSVVRLMGTLDVSVLERSLREIIRRHAILRTTFPLREGNPIQEVCSNSGFFLPAQDLQVVPAPERNARALELIKAQLSLFLDPAQAPPWRIQLLKLGDEHHILALTLHQLVADRWSLGILFGELQEYYADYLEGKSPSQPDLPIQYADYAQWERQWLQGEVLHEQLDFWRRQLSGCTPCIGYRSSRRRPYAPTSQSESQEVLIPADLTQALKRLSHRQGTSLFVTLLAAFKVLLYCSTRQQDLLLCSHVANRNRPETRALIGNFTNLLALRTDLGGNPGFLELLQRVGRVVLGAQTHQDLPFQKLAEIPTLVPTPLTQVMFILQNAPRRPLQLPGVSVEEIRVPTQLSNFPLSLSISRQGSDLRAVFRYQTALFEANTISRMRDDFPALLYHLVHKPERCIHALPLFAKGPGALQPCIPPEPGAGDGNGPRIAARDALELQLAKIWENLLRVEAIDIRDDFFALGGNSLLAVELLVRIERLFGQRLPLDTLWFHGRTLEQLASALRQMDQSASWSRLVPLKPDGDRTPLFCVPTLGGNLFHYFQLASLLHTEQPAYGLQAKGVYGDERPDTTIQAIAADCIATMRTRQPRGPYLIAGFSSGGVVAFEMARQLQAQGNPPAFLGLMDSYVPVKQRALSRTLRNLLAAVRAGDRWMAQERIYHLFLHGLGLDRLRHLRRVGEAHRWAHWSYAPGSYPGIVDLFLTQQSETYLGAPNLGWEPLATGGLKTHYLPGSHRTLLTQPVVDILAVQLEECINRMS